MKKLILILLLLLATYGCGYSPISPAAAAPTQDSIKAIQDTHLLIQKSVDTTLLAQEIMDTNFAQKDTVKKEIKRPLNISKLDTTSVLPEIRKNLQTVNYQQKQLDSLIHKKRK